MFNKKPLSINVVHSVELPELQKTIDEGLTNVKHILRTVGITLAIGIPAAIVFAVAANVTGEVISHNLTTTDPQ